MEGVVVLVEGGDPSCHYLFHHFTKATEETDDPVCFGNSVSWLALLAQKYTFGRLLSARVVSYLDAALDKRYDSIFGPPL
jgi:hypothetical protein